MPKGREARAEIAKALDMLGANAGRATRERRGMVVVIPEEWEGRVARPQRIRNRQSRFTRKERNWHHANSGRRLGRMDIEHQKDLEARLGQDYRRGWTEPGHPRNWPERLTPHRLREEFDE